MESATSALSSENGRHRVEAAAILAGRLLTNSHARFFLRIWKKALHIPLEMQFRSSSPLYGICPKDRMK